MSYLWAWLEKQAAAWIADNLKRVPVQDTPNRGWGAAGSLKANADVSQSVGLTVDFSGQMQTHTVQFDGFDSGLAIGAAPAVVPQPEAEILWSVNGVVIRRVVSVLDGQSVSGMAQAVTVNIRDKTAGGNGAEYRVGVTVAPGVRADTAQPPTLVTNGIDNHGTVWPFGASLVAADSIDWTLPTNAGILSTFLTLTIDPAADLEDVQVTYRAKNLVVLRFVDGNSRNVWAPLPQGTNTIHIANATASTINVSLTLGIDG